MRNTHPFDILFLAEQCQGRGKNWNRCELSNAAVSGISHTYLFRSAHKVYVPWQEPNLSRQIFAETLGPSFNTLSRS
jgi:hypothetical protein